MNKATDATETKSPSAFVWSLSLSATKKSHVRAWEKSQMQTRQHPSWLWTAPTEHVCAWEPCSSGQGAFLKWAAPHGSAVLTDPEGLGPTLSPDFPPHTSALRQKKKNVPVGKRMPSVWLASPTSAVCAPALMNLKSEAQEIPEFLLQQIWDLIWLERKTKD